MSLNFPQTFLMETSLSFLGLGIQPPLTSLGNMVGLVSRADHLRVHLMYDTANMVNAGESPCRPSGCRPPGSGRCISRTPASCRTGTGDIPLVRLLAELLLLGRVEPQVLAFGLEEEVN